MRHSITNQSISFLEEGYSTPASRKKFSVGVEEDSATCSSVAGHCEDQNIGSRILGLYLLYLIIILIDLTMMDRNPDKMAESIFTLTLEILFQLTGEDYTVVKKTSSDGCQAPVCDGWGRPLSPITGPPPHPLILEEINEQKILELTNKMIELLTREVPIRCQDVTVYFSIEEWEYLEGHKDLYKDVMMEDHRPSPSPGRSNKRAAAERCPRPLLPQDDQVDGEKVS
ncbi:uncharacterized protein [Eleutherodactylus coqui]|uniref:uncharacterized protein n=1 Tax=Eleutherodactylus coqui TaxID=57060 RepID=UPI0034627B6B